MLHLQKTTSDGRFTVTIDSCRPPGEILTTAEGVQSLEELSVMLSEASRLAKETAFRVRTWPVEDEPQLQEWGR